MTRAADESPASGQSQRRPVLGWLLVGAGILGIVGGVVPLAITGLVVVSGRPMASQPDLMAHGFVSLGLSVEWAMLSASMGTALGLLLIWAGRGWIKARPWAATLSWAYILCGLMVNIPDMTLFICRARPGSMRTQMLILDGLATALPIALGLWLLLARRERKGPAAPDETRA